jgi:hypothetical protein
VEEDLDEHIVTKAVVKPANRFVMVNEKTDHRRLLHKIGRASDPNCQFCQVSIVESLQHKFSGCPRVAAAWAHTQRTVTILGGWRQLTFDDLLRPTLGNIAPANKVEILKIFIKYIGFVNLNVNNRIDVSELDFTLRLAD